MFLGYSVFHELLSEHSQISGVAQPKSCKLGCSRVFPLTFRNFGENEDTFFIFWGLVNLLGGQF